VRKGEGEEGEGNSPDGAGELGHSEDHKGGAEEADDDDHGEAFAEGDDAVMCFYFYFEGVGWVSVDMWGGVGKVTNNRIKVTRPQPRR